MTITLVAWGVLVFAAIEFGKEARSGEPEAWTFLVLAAARRDGLPVPDADPRRAGWSGMVRGTPAASPGPIGGRRGAR